jgi:hypothetical protein
MNKPQNSSVRATAGRVLHAYSPKWTGPRPALVVTEVATAGNVVNANINFDGLNDREMLAYVRASEQGNTFGSLPVYDALTRDERAEAITHAPAWTPHSIPIILEWPPRP